MGSRPVGNVGSPPRMRGKVSNESKEYQSEGITPAYAGKRLPGSTRMVSSPDHPRVCGEKDVLPPGQGAGAGSPPRMRGKACRCAFQPRPCGITPAYAGKSVSSKVFLCPWRDHPRVCGEKFNKCFRRTAVVGSPPRMRGKAAMRGCTRITPGITPAYAGKRCRHRLHAGSGRDHPRVCGEKSTTTL